MTDGPPAGSPGSGGGLSTPAIMQRVLLACLPGLAALTFFFGWGTLINIVWLAGAALALEAAVLRLRGRRPRPYLSDSSALVTAVLLGLSLPPTLPWWMGLVGIAFAIIVAKHLYGGLGHNLFNPAMVGYVVLLISFPVAMSTWVTPRPVAPGPGLLDSLLAIFPVAEPPRSMDGFTGATALDAFKHQREGMLVSEFRDQSPLLGRWSGTGWEWVNLGFLAGGVYLLASRIITWHIPAAMLGSLALLAALFHDGGSAASGGSPLFHLLGGGTMLGAFFIATDPVTAATTPRGKLIYGALVGAAVYVIRVWGNYPDAVAFAVLLGNFATPLIDYYTPPRAFGR